MISSSGSPSSPRKTRCPCLTAAGFHVIARLLRPFGECLGKRVRVVLSPRARFHNQYILDHCAYFLLRSKPDDDLSPCQVHARPQRVLRNRARPMPMRSAAPSSSRASACLGVRMSPVGSTAVRTARRTAMDKKHEKGTREGGRSFVRFVTNDLSPRQIFF